MILVPIILGAAAVYVYWHAKRKNNIAKIEEYISRRYPIDQKELIKLRRMWNLSVKEVFYLHDYLNQNGFFNKSILTSLLACRFLTVFNCVYKCRAHMEMTTVLFSQVNVRRISQTHCCLFAT
jgi:hypothetical protein